MTKSTYIPGVCNIGEAEIKARKRMGWTCTAVTVVAWAALDYAAVNPLWKLALFVPAAMGATGLIQGFSGFCAGFGMKGVFNFTNQINATDDVSQAEYRAADLRKARQIFAYSILAGVVVAAVAYLL